MQYWQFINKTKLLENKINIVNKLMIEKNCND